MNGYECMHVLLDTLVIWFSIDLPHTADIQIHSWGDSNEEAFIQAAYALLDYMSGRDGADESCEITFSVDGDDISDLLYVFLDEILFRFFTPPFLLIKRIECDGIIGNIDGTYRMTVKWYFMIHIHILMLALENHSSQEWSIPLELK